MNIYIMFLIFGIVYLFGLLVKKNKGKRKETRGERRKTGQNESERELKRKEREKNGERK